MYPLTMFGVSLTFPVMDDLDTATLTTAESRELTEAVATACSVALGGMQVQAVYIAKANGFLVQLAVQAAPEVFH